MEKIVCDHCAGFGHSSTDYRKGPRGERGYCPTGETIDMLVKFCLLDKDKYLIGRRAIRPARVVPDLILPMQTTFHPVYTNPLGKRADAPTMSNIMTLMTKRMKHEDISSAVSDYKEALRQQQESTNKIVT
jgi:hypothetical protein